MYIVVGAVVGSFLVACTFRVETAVIHDYNGGPAINRGHNRPLVQQGGLRPTVGRGNTFLAHAVGPEPVLNQVRIGKVKTYTHFYR